VLTSKGGTALTAQLRIPRSHLMRRRVEQLAATDPGRLALVVTTAAPRLRPFKGVILQYLQIIDTQVRSEGLQAVKRAKAYKAAFLDVVATGEMPQRKYRLAIPIYRIAIQFRSDPFILRLLHTVFRSYDLYTASESLVKSDFEAFESTYMVDSMDKVDHRGYASTLTEVYNFEEMLQLIESTEGFSSFAEKVGFSTPFKPVETSILLTKKGTARYSLKNRSKRLSKSFKGYAPSIVGAPAEQARAQKTVMRGGEVYSDFLLAMSNLIGQNSFPSMKATAFPDPPPKGRRQWTAELRRNVAFGAPGFKTRVIAIGDFWVQYALSPIHDWAFKCLHHISADYTFSHENGFRALSSVTRDNDFVACFDLSSATDAFPVAFSESVLRLVIPGGRALSTMWRRAMTELPFKGKWYRVGQPMGLLSSWAVFSLSHHFVVWYAAAKAGVLQHLMSDPSRFYGIVGDDIFICHQGIAHYYSVVMNALGVKINLTKSLLVDKSRRISEFVKRNSFDGDEISAISPRLIIKSFDDWACTRDLMIRMRDRSYYIGPRSGSASLPDEKALVLQYQCFGSDFVRSAISILCSVPARYAGLASDEDKGPMPPLARLNCLAFKALDSLEFKNRAIYISSDGDDSFNELIEWLRGDNTYPGDYFRTTPFVEWIRKQTTDSQDLFGSRGSIANIYIGQIVQMVENLINRVVSDDDIFLFEKDFLSRLNDFVKPPLYSVKEVERKMSRTLAYRSFKVMKGIDIINDIKDCDRLYSRLRYLLKRYSFEMSEYELSSYYLKAFYDRQQETLGSDDLEYTDLLSEE